MPLKGGGSAYGGKWKPSKPEDERLVGKPGEIKITFKPDGTKIELDSEKNIISKDITMEFDKEYTVTVITEDGKKETRKIKITIKILRNCAWKYIAKYF